MRCIGGGGMSMPGSGHVRLHRKLEALKKRAAAGDQAAAGQAALLARHLESVADGSSKKEDDRVKVLVGAAVLDRLKQTGSLPSGGLGELLAMMDAFLARPGERAAVLGESLRGSDALLRVVGVVDQRGAGAPKGE